MSKKFNRARHRATPVHTSPFTTLSKAVSSNAGTVGRSAAVVAAASGLMLGFGAPAHAGAYAEASSAPAAATAGATVHTVQPGDTLGKIAARYGVSLSSVLSLNGLGANSVIYPGNTITVSGGAAAASPVQAAPVQAAPVQAAPVQAAPVQASPVQVTPVQAASFTQPAPAVQQAQPAVQPQATQAQPQFMLAAAGPIEPIVSSSQNAQAPASGVGAAIVASAYAQLGRTQDCTILAEVALRSVGLSVGDIAPEHFYRYGSVVANPQPGDLVIRPGHVAIYVGNGKVISSGMNGINETIEHSLSDLPGSSFVRVNG